MNFFNNMYNKKRTNILGSKWLLTIILSSLFLIFTGYFFYYIFAPSESKKVKEIKNSWVFYSKDEPEFRFDSHYINYLPMVDRDEPFIMETVLVDENRDSNLMICGNHQWLKVYLNDQVLYDRTDKNNQKSPGLSLAVIDLPTKHMGKELKIEVSSPYANYAGIPPKVYIGETTPIISFIFSQSVPQVVTMIIAIFSGITILIYAVFTFYKKKSLDISLIILSCFALVLGFQTVSEDILSGILFEPIVHSTLADVFNILTSIFLVLYYLSRMIHYKKFYGLFCLFQLSIQLGVLFYSMLTASELTELMPIANVVSVISTLFTSLVCVGEAYRNNRFFIACTPWIVFIAIFHCMLYIQPALGIYYSNINWSTILFMLILVIIIGYNIIEYITRFDKHQRSVNFLKIKSDLLEQHYDQLTAHFQEISSLRFEFIKKMEHLETLIDENQPIQAQNYMKEILNNAQNFKFISSYSSHQLTNLILARYQEMASKININVHFQTDLSENLAVNDDDLTQLLIHVLEHSFRETQDIEDPIHRKIHLSMQEKKKQLFIRCEHSANYDTNLFSQGITENFDDQEQFDLMVIQNITEQYDGTVTHEKKQDTDRLFIHLTKRKQKNRV
ncbi:MAG: GHKL domain-containing protein [Enterococcus lacertideformus]|uniref:GHKL domain-containing protein n=1 Tax=Enterococcus lacertideformus TaxID=2771493 RepID=A0A931B1P9_9ENTE|nr:GHKL domain-containing protein [Enterococcus lacertideformus]